MQIIQGPSWRERFPLDGAGSDILAGALLAPGTVTTDSAAKNKSVFIKSGAAADDVVAVLLALHDFSEVGDSKPEDGSAYVRGDVELALPGAMLSGEYDLSTGLIDVASASSATITITSLEDNIDGAWLLATAGTGVGHLGYVKTSGSGSCVLKSAPATAWTSNTDVIKILPVGHTLGFLTSDRDKFSSQAAVGTAKIRVLYNEIDLDGAGWSRLDPTKQDGRIAKLNAAKDGLGVGVKVRTIFVLENSWFAPND